MDTRTLDLSGLKCPLPALLTRRVLKAAAPGVAIEVLADDPLAYIDIPHMARAEGFELVELERLGNRVRLVLRAG
jgi:tRNA 2-thiouridine synthesizing protein A